MEKQLQYQLKEITNSDELQSYSQWLENGALMAGQRLVEKMMATAIEDHPMSGLDYSVAIFADLNAPHFRHVCFTHHGIMFCALIATATHNDPNTLLVCGQEYANLCRECDKGCLCPIILPLWEDTLTPAIEGTRTFLDAHSWRPIDIEQFKFADNRQISDLELRINAVSLVCQKLMSEGYTNLSYCEVPSFAPEIQCSKDKKRIGYIVKSSPAGLVDTPYQIETYQIAAVNADEYYVAEVTFDYLKGNTGDFQSKIIPRGCGLIGGIQRIVSLENANKEMPYVHTYRPVQFPEGAKVRPIGEMLVDGVLTIPDDWHVIPNGCFAWRMDIEKVIIGREVYGIEKFAFDYCKNLKEIEIIPDRWVEDFVDDDTGEVVSLERSTFASIEIEYDSFIGCENLNYPRHINYWGNVEAVLQDGDWTRNILIQEGNAVEQLRNMIRIDHPEFLNKDLLEKQCKMELAFEGATYHYEFLNGFLFCKEENCCMAYLPEFAATRAVFPEWVTSFSEYYQPPFKSYHPKHPKAGDMVLQELALSSKIDAIPYAGFANFAVLESIILPPIVIGDEDCPDYQTFVCCNKLKKIVFSGGCTIGIAAFQGMESIEEIVFESHVSEDGELMNNITIKEGAFYNCSNLKRIVNNSCNLSIEYSAFDGCSSLTGKTLPESFEAFHDCLYYKGLMVGLWPGDEFIYPEGTTKAAPTQARKVFLPATIDGEQNAHHFESCMGYCNFVDWPIFDFEETEEIVVPIGMKQHFVELFSDYEEFEEHCVEKEFVCDKVLQYKEE